MSNENNFSLLYPTELAKESGSSGLEESLISGLAAESVFSMINSTSRFKPNQIRPMTYFTDDIEVIKYRLDIVEDMISNPSLYSMFVKMLPELEDLRELFTIDKRMEDDTTASLYSISEFELYTDCIDKLSAFFEGDVNLQSVGMNQLAAKIKIIYNSDDFQNLKTEAGKISHSIRHIKSITVGVNLDAQLKPVEAGIVSINTTFYKSGHIIDKILRMDLQGDNYTCLAPLEVIGRGLAHEQVAGFRSAVKNTLNRVFNSSVKRWRPVIRTYTIRQSRFLIRLAEEIRFLIGGVSLLNKLIEAGVPVCKPQVAEMEQRSFSIKGLYNPVVVLHQEKSTDGRVLNPVVLNNFEFDENGRIFILTGPNQGGKTVYAQAVGIAQIMFQLGLFVPGYSATMSPVDHIYIHFPLENDNYTSNGRFAEECKRLMKVFNKLSRSSLLLMDETFSSTSASEASYIAEQMLKGLQAIGCRVIFATHLHDLAKKIDELNEQSTSTASRIDSLVAELDADQAKYGKRSYRISRSRPLGDSFARDIADKYGLTFEKLMAALQTKDVIPELIGDKTFIQ